MVSLPADCAAEPFRARLASYLKWSVGLALLFLATYTFTNWLAGQRAARLTLFWDWELGIPFVPWMIYVYGSFQLLAALPVLFLDRAGIRRLGQAFAAVTIVAAVFHAILPADLGWPRPAEVPGYPVYKAFFAFDRPHNLVPSLHMAYSTLTMAVVWSATKVIWWRVLVAAWLLILAASVLLVHQHHLVDVVSGLALGAVCYQIVYRPAAGKRIA